MYRRVLAFDFDGTLAEQGTVPLVLQTALEQLHASGCALFMVTRRRFAGAQLGSSEDLLAGIVWENGAVLQHTAADEVYLSFGHIDAHLVEGLELAGIPLEHGRAAVPTTTPHDESVWHVLNQWGGDATVVHNTGVVRVLPPGAAKRAGLERLLGLCGFSPRNLASFGDGDDDLSLLQPGKTGLAVSDAVPSLREVADLMTTQPGPVDMLEVSKTYCLKGSPSELPTQRERLIPLGADAAGTLVSLPVAALVNGNLGVFGDSGSGKSWVTGLLVEGMHHAGYRVLLIDPEGDFKGMRALLGFVALRPQGTHTAG